MFLDHFIKAFWGTVIILVVAMCISSCVNENKNAPIHSEPVEYIGNVEGE